MCGDIHFSNIKKETFKCISVQLIYSCIYLIYNLLANSMI